MRKRRKFKLTRPKRVRQKAIVTVGPNEAWAIYFGLKLLSQEEPGREFHKNWIERAERLVGKYEDIRQQLETEEESA